VEVLWVFSPNAGGKTAKVIFETRENALPEKDKNGLDWREKAG